ncbi:protein unc-79 homolog isoform X4 [Scaptodrosophila lebanonensis]|uniref:Protein unc-79 homolog isoform X4 n=1 Tax=Drosophila lebanonensis TaxID=7225 RepID=A0A6J2THM1_DROLE|nr:protein unc-79 homolog isoform X4 [Scaptodrosophila lebanonensis]
MTGSFKVQLINMGTRAAAFQAKLRALHEYHVRLLHNVLPAPSGVDIANNIKYFSQTLLTVLKDVRTSPHDLIRDPLEDPTRMSAYPNLEYGNLYNALTMLIDVAPCIQYGQIVFGKALLQCLSCILPFLDKDLIDNLPYLVSSTISVLPPALHQDIVNALCYYILPFTITRRTAGSDEQECQACQSVSSVIMMVLQYSNNPAHHCQLLECLMTLKHNVVKDILCVVAYGTAVSRTSAAKLLFYYWPAFDANLFDRKVLLSKLTNDLVPFTCQREHCPNAGNAEAAKVCYDHSISITYAPDCPPPLYLCIECANEIHREHANLEFGDILHPMQQVSMVCENKNCRSNEKSAFSICFSTECASYNGNHPIRYCAQCHSNRHNSRRGGDHVVHRSLQPAWQMDPEMQMHMVECVVSLLREAKPLNFEPGKDSSDAKKNGGTGTADNISLEERQMLGRYGIWLLVGRCTPTADTPVEVLGRILSMLFHWFHVTAYSYDAAGQIESTIEKLKVDHVCNWLKEICRIHYNVFIACLLPHPPEYARVGGHWETLASRTSHLKEGLQRLICLVPYEVITSEIWDYVMPHWMEAITNDVAEKELNELKIVLSKILDPEMSPLGFDAKTMYNFVAIRFEKTTAKVQQQALHWLQILTKLEILIPLVQLFAMFGDGVRIMKYGIQHELMREKEKEPPCPTAKAPKTPCKEAKADMANPPRRSSISPVVEDDSGNTSAISDDEGPTNRHTEFSTDAEHNLTCCILMLDILLKQMELQDVEQHMGIHTSVCENVSRLIKCMVTAARVGLSSHVCSLKVAECAYCEASIMWHQLSTKLVQFMAPLNPVRPPDVPIEDIIEEEKSSRKSPPESDKEKTRERDVSLSMAPLPIPLGPLGGFADIFKLDQFFSDDGKIIIMAGPVPVAVPQPEPHSVGGVLVHMPHVCSIMTATVETVSEQLDLASILPSDRAIARSITLSDADVGSANVSVTKASVMGENGVNGSGAGEDGSGSDDDEEEEDSDDFWHTSVGKFKFTLDQLPQTLQYIHQLLTEIPTIKKPEILYYVLQCLNTMALHGDALAKAAREQRGFFIWCQENLLIKNLWELCNAEHSHICQVGVPLLLHCITLPLGSDVFWRVVQEAFHDTDWRVRFTAVERVTVITRFMDSTPLRTEVGLQTALATAFCHLIASMDDINVYVAQRATLYIGTIHDTAIRSLLFCLESQFDLFIVDRPVVLQSVYQLHNSLSDRKMLNWEFFLNRFDTLFVEAQINLEKCGDISYLRDLRNSDNGSEALSAKILKAREALSQSDTSGSMAKTLSASFGTKWPYKRTMSAPASMVPRQDSKFVPEKEKIYSRQVSAPILKRKTSRFGLDGHIHSLGGLNDDHLIGLLSRITELEESDRETIHLLVFLLMQFMSRTDQAFPSEDKPVTRTQNIVLKHLFLLLGHNQIDKTFHTSPDSLRVSAVFNAFLANLPQVLDQNHLIGGLILPSVMQIILYAPNPTNTSGDSYQNLVFNYSLWHLEQYPRRNWLFTLLVVLYKYSYTQPPLSGYVISAIRIIMNSMRGHFHQCRRIPTTTILDIQGVGGAARSRDVSQPSLGTDPDDKEASPPASPMFPSEGTSAASKSKGQNVAFTPKLQHAFRKYNDSSLDADETESELVAIPESDLSDSTLHGSSAPGSFDDTIHFEDVMPAKLETLRHRRGLEYTEEKSTKVHKSMITTKTGDTYTTKIKATTSETVSTTVVTTHTRHSLQEGVRMIVTPLVGAETAETAIVSPPVDVHRAVTVRNKSLENAAASTSKMFAAIATNHLKALGALQEVPTGKISEAKASGSSSGSRSTTNGSSSGSAGKPTTTAAASAAAAASSSKPIGRHKTIVECSAGNSSSSNTTSNAEETRHKKSQTKSLKRSDKTYGSPDSPLSKMNVMPNPRDEADAALLPPPKNIAQLEIPTPERLLPIGTQDSVAALVERVREGLHLPDISHLKQDSLDVSESTKDDVTPSSRTASPRRLIKQVALESPPNPNAPQPQIAPSTAQSQQQPDLHTSILKNVSHDLRSGAHAPGHVSDRQHAAGTSAATGSSIKRPRQKLAPFNVDTNAIPDIRSRFAGSWPPPPFQPAEDNDDDADEAPETANGHTSQAGPSAQAHRGSSRRVGDYTVVERCSDCGAVIEEYTDEEIGILIVILGTFIHREPAIAAPFLPEILTMTSRICLSCTHAWQGENGPPLASSAQAVALQFIRCVLHQLAPNGIFSQVFQTQMKMKIRHNHFRSIAKALQDFQDLNATSPIYMVCESLTSKKALPVEQLPVIFRNMAEYLQCVPVEAGVGLAVWSQAMQAMESLLRQVIVIMPSLSNPEYLLDLIASTLRLNCVPKTLLDPYSKIMAYCVQHTNLEYQTIYDLCTLNTRSFNKDRDKNLLCRQMIYEFVQALKFKSNIPDHNLLMIIGFVLLDAGGTLPPGALPGLPETAPALTTNAADCLRQYISNDVIDFLADFHTLSKIKNFKNGQTSNGLGEDTLGGVLKGAVAQYLALEMSRGNSRDNRAVTRYLPWLNNAPSSLQQGPKEFTECVGHMRLLSWLLLGSLTHMALMQRRAETQALPPPTPPPQQQGQPPAPSVHYQHQGVTYSQPVPQEASCHIADHIQVIFAGFAEQSKASVLHMSSLFHAFTLCQLWTVYLEQMAHNTNSNIEGSTLGVLFEFWAKVTPCILQLVSHAKPASKDMHAQSSADFQTQSANAKLSEMVNLHFLSLLEALKETNSTVLGKLLPMWSPVLSSQTQLSDTLHVRLQNVRDYAPDYEEQQAHKSEALLKWLQRLQFKMGQIELQASTATQFYSI